MLRDNPGTLFVFGDNMERVGLGGQAKEMRGEPNAVGIPTKWGPSTKPGAYFKDADFPHVQDEIDKGFDRLVRHVNNGGTVVWPEDGIGTGLADLPRKAPKIYAYLQSRLEELS